MLLVELRGAWNAELIDSYDRQSRPLMAGLSAAGRWGVIADDGAARLPKRQQPKFGRFAGAA